MIRIYGESGLKLAGIHRRQIMDFVRHVVDLVPAFLFMPHVHLALRALHFLER